MKTKKRSLRRIKRKVKQFGHSERELWEINCVGCPYYANITIMGNHVCTNRWNKNAKKHSVCHYLLCPIKQAVAYEDYDDEEQEEY